MSAARPRRDGKRGIGERAPVDVARAPVDDLVENADASLLELVDHLLNQGVVVSGELILGVAGVDLVYARVALLLCAADRVLPTGPAKVPAARRRRRAP